MKHTISKFFPLFIVYALLCTVPLGNLLRLNVLESSFYPHDVLLSLWLLYTVFTGFWKKVRLPHSSLILKFALIWTFLGMLFAVLRSHDFMPFLYLIRLAVYLAASYSLVKTLPTRIHPFLLSLGLLTAAAAAVLYVLSPDMRFLALLGWDDHYYRAIGTLFDPGFTGMLALLTLCVLVFSPHQKKYRLLVILGSIFLVTLIFLTYSRASYLALVAVGVYAVVRTQVISLKNSCILLSLCVLLAFFAPRPGGEGVDLFRQTSITARLQVLQRSLRITTLSDAVIGTGLFSRFSHDRSATGMPTTAHFPDNLFALIFVQTGVVGFVLWTILLFRAFKKLLQKQSVSAPALGAVLVHAQFNNTLFQPFVLLFVLFVLMDDR